MRDILVKLSDNARFRHSNDCIGLRPLGSGKLVKLDARRIVALEDLLDIDLHNHHGY